MRAVREAVGSAVSSSDLTVYQVECDADRVGALAVSRGLAAELVRWKHGQSGNERRLLAMLVRELVTAAARRRWRTNKPAYLEALAARALVEWRDEACVPCLGRGWVQRGNGQPDHHAPRVACRACAGSGKARWTPGQRAVAVGMPLELFQPHWERRLDRVVWTLQALDAHAAGVLTAQLERASIRATD